MLRPVALQQCQRLYGFAEAHVVRETRAEAGALEETQPRVAALLVRTQRSGEARGLGKLFPLAFSFEALEEVAYRARAFDLFDRKRAARFRESRADQVANRRLLFLANELQRLADLLGRQLHPLATHFDQRRLQLR